MRYQYGTSIGHRHYMQDPDFPSRVVVPIIPADFDYGLPEVGQPSGETMTAMETDPSHATESGASVESGPSTAGRPAEMEGVESELQERWDDGKETKGGNDVDEPVEDDDNVDDDDSEGYDEGSDEENETRLETEGENSSDDVDSTADDSEYFDE